MRKTIFADIIACLLIILFVYAAINKLLAHESFVFQLGRSPYINSFAGVLSWLVPTAELVIAGLLTMQRFKLTGLYLSFFLMAMFSGYIFLLLHFSPYVPCSCGGVLASMSWSQHLVFNIAFTLLALAGIWLLEKRAVHPPLSLNNVQ